MRIMSFLSFLFILQSCTLSFIMTDTHGQAEDVVDNTPSTEADVNPVIEIPFKGI